MEEQLIQGYIPQNLEVDPKKIGKDYLPTLLEYFWIKSEQIVRNITIGLGNSDIYVVPLGKILIITNCWINVNSNTSGDGGRIALSNSGAGADELVRIKVGAAGHMSQTISYPLPFILKENSIINVAGTGAGITEVRAGFVGFLITKELIPSI